MKNPLQWFRSRRALLAELQEERQTAHYFRSIVKKEYGAIDLVDWTHGSDGLRASFKSPGCAGLLAAFMAQSLKACGAKSYVEMRAQHPDYGEMIFSVRRESGQTPAERAHELECLFDRTWDSDLRAIKRWQAAHPGNDNVWPDRADMVVWLMEQLTKRESLFDGAKIIHDDGKRYRIEHPDWMIQPVGNVTCEQAKAICEAALHGAAHPLEAVARQQLAALADLVREIRAYQSPECDDPGALGAAELKAADAAIVAAEEALGLEPIKGEFGIPTGYWKKNDTGETVDVRSVG